MFSNKVNEHFKETKSVDDFNKKILKNVSMFG